MSSGGFGQFIPLLIIGMIIWFFVARNKAKKLDPKNELQKAKKHFLSQENVDSDINSFPHFFLNSIKICFKKYSEFEGRADKSEFYYFFIFYVVGKLIFTLAAGDPGTLIFALIAILPLIAVSARRLNDIKKSRWWLLLYPTGLGIIPLLFILSADSKK